jgi:hypothetical protein
MATERLPVDKLYRLQMQKKNCGRSLTARKSKFPKKQGLK